jgi:hypothetical protein
VHGVLEHIDEDWIEVSSPALTPRQITEDAEVDVRVCDEAEKGALVEQQEAEQELALTQAAAVPAIKIFMALEHEADASALLQEFLGVYELVGGRVIMGRAC